MNILYIEDNDDDVFMIKEMLDEHGDDSLHLNSANTLSKGFDYIANNNVDVILLDLGLPESNGLPTVHKVLQQNLSIPFIVFTGNSDAELGIQAINLGAQDFLVKGQIYRELLVKTINFATIRYNLIQELDEKSNALEKASRYKSEFLANMSHELRSPLNSLLILSEILSENQEQNLTADQIKSAELIHRGGSELLDLINDLLDLAKVESGKLTMHFDNASITAICENLHGQFSPIAKKKDLKFKIDIANDLADTLMTDKQRMLQILKNLLSNAFKFTFSGSVEFNVYTPNADIHFNNGNLQVGEVIAFSVVDTGTGIEKDKQDAIFEAFQQADNSITRNFGGTGLGLSISREFSKALGGEIHVKSIMDKGSTFTLILPINPLRIMEKSSDLNTLKESGMRDTLGKCEPKSERQECTDSINGKQCPFIKRVVLLVEDDDRNIFALSKILKAWGFTVITATNGQRAIEELEHRDDIDLVLMDMMMPIMDGLKATQKIRNHVRYKELPIIFLTAKAMPEDKANCLEAGANDYLAKPIDKNQLFSLIEKYLNRKSVYIDGAETKNQFSISTPY